MNRHRDCNRTEDNPVPIPCPLLFSAVDPPTIADPRTNSARDRSDHPDSFQSLAEATFALNPMHSRTAARPLDNLRLGPIMIQMRVGVSRWSKLSEIFKGIKDLVADSLTILKSLV